MGVAEDDWNAEEELDVERARVTSELIAGVRGLPASEVPEALCRACVSLLPVASGLSVSVLGDSADMGVVLCASDSVAARLAEIQYTLGEGPGMEAVRLRAPVFATDLTRPPATRRWPLFSVQAAKAGAEAAFSLPLAGGAGALGTLDLYRETSGSLSDDHIRTALLVADAVALAVIALDHASARREGVVTWLAAAEADREEVHQATGMMMVRLGVNAEEALLRLRARAFAEGRTTTEIARGVIDGTLDLRDD
ncbi:MULTISPECIES: GAF and ANTAR domain-containing protein [unclassified Streptomyces]|uniref:GAF and ANTAR domain-containing protein n=1 Tax=Streptomyces sp. ST1020 TaxID=1848901 RepID=UPI000DDAE660|nr:MULTISPECIES: GAF and ANTAR domain-containing protein [unclassified Streptomyces]QZZ32352.1 GAF and ANTAR domain-containing protein [Streptomyces sp. ST1015]